VSTLSWSRPEDQKYETGVSMGVLYTARDGGGYSDAHPWNGLVSINEAPSGAEITPVYAGNFKYLMLRSAEEFSGTIEAYTYPTSFEKMQGRAIPTPGVAVSSQNRERFGLCYTTLVGSGVQGAPLDYKIHLVWNAVAGPSERTYATTNDSPEPSTLSWEFVTEPYEFKDHEVKPSAYMVFESSKSAGMNFQLLQNILFGDEFADAYLPSPDYVLGLMRASIDVIDGGTPFSTTPDKIDGGSPSSKQDVIDGGAPNTKSLLDYYQDRIAG